MNYCNFYAYKEDAQLINNEIEFVAGKAGLSEERAIEIMKIQLLSDILGILQNSKEVNEYE